LQTQNPPIMDKTALLDDLRSALGQRITAITRQRTILETLRERTDLGTLQIDIEQAIEEMDLLLTELQRTFPG
jgi:hypothetical protein